MQESCNAVKRPLDDVCCVEEKSKVRQDEEEKEERKEKECSQQPLLFAPWNSAQNA